MIVNPKWYHGAMIRFSICDHAKIQLNYFLYEEMHIVIMEILNWYMYHGLMI